MLDMWLEWKLWLLGWLLHLGLRLLIFVRHFSLLLCLRIWGSRGVEGKIAGRGIRSVDSLTNHSAVTDSSSRNCRVLCQ